MADDIVVLRGGPRDGETTTVARATERLLAVSDAPGLLEVYEANGETQAVPHNDQEAFVFVHVGQETSEGVAPELLT